MGHITHFLIGMWHNAALMAACVAIVCTQILKIFIHFSQHRYWNFHKVIEAGGMPSSHAAGVVALSTALGFIVGPKSPVFATAVVFSAIVLYDAGGIRRHAGEHAVLLNRLALEIDNLDVNVSPRTEPPEEGERLKEILGHEPKEVLLGALLGVLIGAAFAKWWIM